MAAMQGGNFSDLVHFLIIDYPHYKTFDQFILCHLQSFSNISSLQRSIKRDDILSYMGFSSMGKVSTIFGVLVFLFLIACNEVEDNIRTPIPPVESTGGSTDYTLLHREHTGYITTETGEFQTNRQLRNEENTKYNHISILRLPSQLAVEIPSLTKTIDDPKSPKKTRIMSTHNSYLDIFFLLPKIEMIKKDELSEFVDSEKRLLSNENVLSIRVYGLWQTSKQGKPGYFSQFYLSDLEHKYELGCDRSKKIDDGVFRLTRKDKNKDEKRETFTCDNENFTHYAFYDSSNVISGGGYCYKTRNCIFTEWVNDNRKISYSFNHKYFERMKEIGQFAKNFVKKSIIKDW